jgi:hypothetical protein
MKNKIMKNIYKKISLIIVILISFILLRSLPSILIPFIPSLSANEWTSARTLVTHKEVLYSHMVLTHYFFWLLFLPILVIRTMLMNFNVDEKLFKKEVLFNICYIFLFIILDCIFLLSYGTQLYLILVFLGLWFALRHFKKIKRYTYNLYD